VTRAQVKDLELGFYRLYWKDGGDSLAAVGQDAHGQKWFAPTNWIVVPSSDWASVERVSRLAIVAEPCGPSYDDPPGGGS